MALRGAERGVRRWLVSSLVLFLGVFLVGWDARSQEPDFLIPPPPGVEGVRPQELPLDVLRQTEQKLRDYLMLHPAHEQATLGLASVLLRQKRHEDAVALLEQATADNPESRKLALALGQVYLEAGCTCEAVRQFESIWFTDPDYPDLQYWISSAYLRAEYPLAAYRWASCDGPVSSPEVSQAQTLIRGSALAQLGLRCEASTLFQEVEQESGHEQLSARAVELQHQMDDALCSRSRLYGVLAVTARYDDNPGVLPTTNLFGTPLARQRTWGNVYSGLAAYDVVRGYNHDVTAGYTFFHSANYSAGSTDLLDNAFFLNAVNRGLWNDMPYQAGLRADYDYLLAGSDSFLQRAGITPNVTLFDSDLTSVSLLFRYTVLDFLRQGAADGTARDADSDDYAAGIFRQRQLCCRDFSYVYGYIYDRNDSQGRDFRYNGHQFQAGFNWLLPWQGVQLSLLGSIYHRDYDNPDSILLQTRRDMEYGLQTVVLYPIRGDWFATFAWRLDRNDSNLATSDYVRQTFDVGLQYNFGGTTPFLRRGGDSTYGQRMTW